MTTMTEQRFTLGAWPTRLHRVRRLERELGTGPILVKRDDLTGFATAGNKTRPLEYLLGAALAESSDVLVTGGRAASNFCAAAAAAAAAAEIDCHLIIATSDQVRLDCETNTRMARALGAELHTVRAVGTEIDEQIFTHAVQLMERGRRPYAVPRGGSTAVGAMGYASAAEELNLQLVQMGEEPAAVVCAVGSGGTYAGLLAGAAALQWNWPVLGASVSRPLDEITDKVFCLAQQVADLRGTKTVVPRSAIEMFDAVGAGHGHLTRAQQGLADLALRTEGLLLDSTYTVKAFELAVDCARSSKGAVVFWHTGGTVAAVARLLGKERDD
jgi:1-aminocyclopropane-1-carboxylate deaminase/D-cysteine desulfhydrase-like pyridoxal-dependent ACC family enzyme